MPGFLRFVQMASVFALHTSTKSWSHPGSIANPLDLSPVPPRNFGERGKHISEGLRIGVVGKKNWGVGGAASLSSLPAKSCRWRERDEFCDWRALVSKQTGLNSGEEDRWLPPALPVPSSTGRWPPASACQPAARNIDLKTTLGQYLLSCLSRSCSWERLPEREHPSAASRHLGFNGLLARGRKYLIWAGASGKLEATVIKLPTADLEH